MSWLENIGRHRRLQSLLSSYIDGQVEASQANALEEHLATCERCQQELESLRFTVDVLREVPPLPLPRSFTLKQQVAPAPRTSPYVWAMSAATSVAALLLAVLMAGDFTGQLYQGEAALSPVSSPSDQPASAITSMEVLQESETAAIPVPSPAPVAAAMPSPAPEIAADTSLETQAAAAPEAPKEEREEESGALQAEAFEAEEPEEPTEAPLTRIPLEEETKPSERSGISLPLWQIEATLGAAFVLLGAATLWIWRRVKRRESS